MNPYDPPTESVERKNDSSTSEPPAKVKVIAYGLLAVLLVVPFVAVAVGVLVRSFY